MTRPQFSLKTLLWLMVCAACFFGGSEWRKRHSKPGFIIYRGARLGTLGSNSGIDTLVQQDGTEWIKVVYTGTPPTHEWRSANGDIVTVRIEPAGK